MSANIPAAFWVDLKAFLKRKNELWRFGWLNCPNQVNMDQRYRDSDGKNKYSDAISAAIESDRTALINIIERSTGLEQFWKMIREYINSPYDPNGTAGEIDEDFWQDLIVDMQTAAVVTIRSRNFTRGAPAYVGTGTGGLLRRSTDKNSIAIEEGIAATVVIECVEDASTTVTEGDEIFKLKTTGDVKDGLEKPTGYNYDGETITAMHTDSQGNLLSNGNFRTFSAGTTPKFDGWSSRDWTMIDQDTATYYRIAQNTRQRGDNTSEAGLGASCKMLPFAGGNRAQIYKRFDSQAGFNKNIPYAFVVFHYGGAGADGNIKMSLGSQNSTVAVAVGVWTVQSLLYFPSEFDASPLDVSIERLADTAGNAYISNVILVPMTKFNGEWYLNYAGPVNYILGDSWTQAVSLPEKDVTTPFAVEGKLQREIVKRTGKKPEKMNGRYMNHSTTPTVDDWTQITGTGTFVAGPAVTLAGVDTKYLTEIKEDYYAYNATDDLPDDAVACDAPTTNTAMNLKVAYPGTAGAGKKIGIIIPWEDFC